MSSSKEADEWITSVTGEVQSWPGISLHAARFGGNDFRFASAEAGHIHHGGAMHIPFPRAVRDELLAVGLAAEHP